MGRSENKRAGPVPKRMCNARALLHWRANRRFDGRLSATRLIEPIPLLRNVGGGAGLQEKNRNGGQHEVDQIPPDLGWRARRCGGSKVSVPPGLLLLPLITGLRPTV